MPNLIWFRTDLRTQDNPALAAATANPQQPALGVVFITHQQWQEHGLGQRKIQLICNRILALQQELAELNIPLLILEANTFTASINRLQELIIQLKITDVYFNLEYEVNERRRDINFKRWCKQEAISFHQYHDQCLLAPNEVLTGQGQMFKVFTPFKRAWLQLAASRISPPLPAPEPLAKEVQQPLISLVAEQNFSVSLANKADPLWPVAANEIAERLTHFVTQVASQYDQQRDFPSLDSTSRLSPYLSLGALSPRQCLFAAFQHNEGQLAGGNAGLASWVNELIWREFYRHLLVAYPNLSKHQAFKENSEPAQWRICETDFQAWCEGKTGYPLVDAAQRQLQAEGWVHNRLRMVSAMFLTKHLLIDWRKGEVFYSQHLVDADLASNNGGWQWSASTGADGVPYFRIFNPTTQAQRFDAEGKFIAKYVPELASLPAKNRINPSLQDRQAYGYPAEIVEHKFARLRALEAFKAIGL